MDESCVSSMEAIRYHIIMGGDQWKIGVVLVLLDEFNSPLNITNSIWKGGADLHLIEIPYT